MGAQVPAAIPGYFRLLNPTRMLSYLRIASRGRRRGSRVTLRNFHHRPRSWLGKGTPGLLEVVDDILDDLPQLFVNLDRIIAMDASDQIGAFADVDLVLVAPFHPAMILVDWFHWCTSSIACFTCF